MALTTRPAFIPLPEASAFPPDLLAMRHWVAYDLEERESGWTKTPIDARPGQRQGRYARSNDPQTWTTFTEAHAFAARRGLGLGFMLAPPLVGIDIDDCRDPETGELTPIAASVLGEVDTYAEVSVSGTGVKGIARGTKPGGRCRRKGLQLEIYSERRLFALTGKRLPDAPLEVNDCQEAIDHIYGVAFGQQDAAPSVPWNPAAISNDDDQAVIDWLHNYRNGARFARYWNGQDDGDASGADQGMANMIAYRVGPDPARIEALFSASGRAGRDKWQKRVDYRERTIRKAIDSCNGRFYEVRPAPRSAAPPPAAPPLVANEVPVSDMREPVDPAFAELLALPHEELARRAYKLQRFNRAYFRFDKNKKIRTQKPTIRAVLFEFQSLVSSGKVDTDGWAPTSLPALGDIGGVSKDAAGDHLKEIAAWKVGIHKQVREEEYCIPTGNGGEIIQSRPRLYIKVDGEPYDILLRLAEFDPPPAKKSNGEEKDTWGGKREPCPMCRSQRRLKVVSCADCGHEFGRKVEEPPADTLLPQREEPITAADLADEQLPEAPAADVPSVPPTPIVVPAPQSSYPHGAVTYHEAVTEPAEEPDDWDPYECNHPGCVRPVVIGQRYCGEHRSKYVFGAKVIPLVRSSAVRGIEPPPEDHWEPPTEYDADDMDRVEVAPLRGRIVDTPQGPREVFTL